MQPRHERMLWVVVWGLFALAVLRMWILPLGSSLWIDEAGTAWAIQGNLSETIDRSYGKPGQPSVLYSVIAWCAVACGGLSEIVLRLPSLLGMALAAFLLYRLGIRLLGRQAASYAVVVFASHWGIAFSAADARPYALALAAVTGACLCLVKWFEEGRRRYGAGYVLLAALGVYLHYLAALMLPVHAAYALPRLRRGERARLKEAAVAGLSIVALLAPLSSHASSLWAARAAHSWAGKPYFNDLAAALADYKFSFGLLAGLLLAFVVARPLAREPLPAGHAAPVWLAWWLLIPPAALFAVSRLTAANLFYPRYFVWSVPALALLAGWGIRTIGPPRSRAYVLIGFQVAATLSFGGLNFSPRHGETDWRAAMQKVRTMAAGGQTPVLFRTPFPESCFPEWRRYLGPQSCFTAPLVMYPAGGRVVPLARCFDDRARVDLEHIAEDAIAGTQRLLYVSEEQHDAHSAWLEGRLGPAGFLTERMEGFGRIGVVLFERKGHLADGVSGAPLK